MGVVCRFVTHRPWLRHHPYCERERMHCGTSTGRLMIAVLGGLADVERDLIRTRTAEGRNRAQKHGQRPPRLTAEQKAEARRRREEGATLAELARSYDVSKSTISRPTA
jgi:DNA invertase Pin-like site-specific DNA recombinase